MFVENVASRPYLHASSLRRNLLKSGWRAVYNRLQIESITSAKDRKLFDQALADPPPLTMETAKATFGDYLTRPRFHILRGLAEAFTQLDPAYKSHTKVRIGAKGLPKRVILSNWGGFSSTYGRDLFKNMADALAAVRGQSAVEWCEMLDIDEQHKVGGDAVMNGRTLKRFRAGQPDEPFAAPDRGLTIRRFANGNAHVFFDRDALVAVNRGLGEFYGEVLPDAEEEGVKPSASTAVSKDLQFYWSPPAVIEAALEFAGVPSPAHYRSGYHKMPVQRVLEPSCGDGRILDALRERGHRALGIEYHPGRAAEARAKGHAVLVANFLEHPATPEFDAVVMNPPFYGRHYVQHVRHAYTFLRPGGTLVAILPATARYDYGELAGEWRDLPVASFAEAGTNVPTTMLKMRARP
ncbi:class I SAM-dependent methyltransferase [Novosphingobium sp. 9]|uniref:class I SAM-dependent methyltransferase n=1 Tax=Novosphingobium sp. 9 TaxID=2025349 RepID=UPI0021B5D444|nr:class I SAM-dependent methyltransferase [Novosphingobium sp. 9]